MGYLFAFLFTYCCILSWIWAVKPRYIDYPRFIHKVMSRVHWPIPWENVNIRVTVYSNIVKIRTWCNQDHLTSSFRKSEIKIRLSINMYLGQATFCWKIIFRTFFSPHLWPNQNFSNLPGTIKLRVYRKDPHMLILLCNLNWNREYIHWTDKDSEDKDDINKV